MSPPAPRFSIITVVKDDVAGAIATLASVFAQTCPDYEVIVQDGASTDGTTEAMEGFGDWIDDFQSAPDSGIYEAMNRALARARGDWVQFLNAGDVFADPGVLARVSDRLRDRVDILVGQAIRAEDGMVHEYLPRDMFWAGSINDHQASFVRRGPAQELGFDARFRVAGDLDFFTRARDRGLVDRAEEIAVVRKPFATGVSTDFMARFRERAEILIGRYDGEHPVRKVLARSLRGHLRQVYAPPEELLKGSDLDRLLELEARWAARRAA